MHVLFWPLRHHGSRTHFMAIVGHQLPRLQLEQAGDPRLMAKVPALQGLHALLPAIE